MQEKVNEILKQLSFAELNADGYSFNSASGYPAVFYLNPSHSSVLNFYTILGHCSDFEGGAKLYVLSELLALNLPTALDINARISVNSTGLITLSYNFALDTLSKEVLQDGVNRFNAVLVPIASRIEKIVCSALDHNDNYMLQEQVESTDLMHISASQNVIWG